MRNLTKIACAIAGAAMLSITTHAQLTVRLPGLLRSITVITNDASLTVNARRLVVDVGGVDLAASPGTTVHTVVTATQESTGAVAIGVDEQVARKTPPPESSMFVPVNLVKGSPRFAPGEVTLCYSAVLRERGVVIRSWTLCGTVDFDYSPTPVVSFPIRQGDDFFQVPNMIRYACFHPLDPAI